MRRPARCDPRKPVPPAMTTRIVQASALSLRAFSGQSQPAPGIEFHEARRVRPLHNGVPLLSENTSDALGELKDGEIAGLFISGATSRPFLGWHGYPGVGDRRRLGDHDEGFALVRDKHRREATSGEST